MCRDHYGDFVEQLVDAVFPRARFDEAPPRQRGEKSCCARTSRSRNTSNAGFGV
jgi:hypothetical protein